MSDASPTVDLTNCDREPIHILGAIQPIGFLLALSSDWLIMRASANVAQFLDLEPDDSEACRVRDPAHVPPPSTVRTVQDGGPCLLETKFREWDATRHVDRIRRACPLLKQLTVEGSGCSMIPWPLLSVCF